MYVDEATVEDETLNKPELLADIKRIHTQIRRRHTIGELLVGVVGSLAAILISRISLLTGLSLLLSVYLIVLPLSMMLRSIIVDTLAYTGELVDVQHEEIQRSSRPTSLIFERSWNRMLLENEPIIHKLILISFVKGEFVLGYELGEDLIKKVLTTEMTLEDAFDQLVYEQLGEETPEANIFRRFIRRIFGI
jgi:hypothetical protein